MIEEDNYFMSIAIKEAKKAYKRDEIPVGAIVVSNDKQVIGKAYNSKDKKNVVINHAEILAIIKANKKMKNWRLKGATLYTTLEPCDMCKEVIKEAKVEKVIYAAEREKKNGEKNFYQINDEKLISICQKMMKSKFNEIRDNNDAK